MMMRSDVESNDKEEDTKIVSNIDDESVATCDNSASIVSAADHDKQRKMLLPYAILLCVVFLVVIVTIGIVSWFLIVNSNGTGHTRRPLVFGNVLTNEEIKSIVLAEEQLANATRFYKDNKIISRIPLNATFIQRLSTYPYAQTSSSEGNFTTVVNNECTNRIPNDDGSFSGSVTVAFAKILQGKTPRHVDSYQDGPRKGQRVTGSTSKTGFIVLNDNPTAIFIHGTSHIPLAKSNLVVFDGTMKHNTFVEDGTVSILGPFDMSDGGCFYPFAY